MNLLCAMSTISMDVINKYGARLGTMIELAYTEARVAEIAAGTAEARARNAAQSVICQLAAIAELVAVERLISDVGLSDIDIAAAVIRNDILRRTSAAIADGKQRHALETAEIPTAQ